MNADEAEKCLEKALQYFKSGDFPNAHKFFCKSVRLNPSEKGFKLLHMCEQKIKETAENSKTNDAHEEKKPQPSEKEVPIQRNYTDLQAENVKKMRAKKDFYDLLGVVKTATEDEIKKQFKKVPFMKKI